MLILTCVVLCRTSNACPRQRYFGPHATQRLSRAQDIWWCVSEVTLFILDRVRNASAAYACNSGKYSFNSTETSLTILIENNNTHYYYYADNTVYAIFAIDLVCQPAKSYLQLSLSLRGMSSLLLIVLTMISVINIKTYVV